jgi:hypothetical protein
MKAIEEIPIVEPIVYKNLLSRLDGFSGFKKCFLFKIDADSGVVA